MSFAARAMQAAVAWWTPDHLRSRPKVWLDHESALTDVAGYASAWRSRGSLGGVFTQDTPSCRPLVLPSGLNGRRALRFDGVDDYLLGKSEHRGIFSSVSHGVVFAVYRRMASTSRISNVWCIGGGPGYGNRFTLHAGLTEAIGPKNAPTLVVRRRDGDGAQLLAATADQATNWCLCTAQQSWASARAQMTVNADRVTAAVGTPGDTDTSAPSDGPFIGTEFLTNFSDIELAALLLWSTTSGPVGEDELNRIEGYYAHAFALQSSLAANHPFRHAVPYECTPALQHTLNAPFVVGFVAATSGAETGAAIGPATPALGTWFNGGPAMTSGQGIKAASAGGVISVTLTGLTPPVVPAPAVLMDHAGLPVARMTIASSGSVYTGSAPGVLASGSPYYLQVGTP